MDHVHSIRGFRVATHSLTFINPGTREGRGEGRLRASEAGVGIQASETKHAEVAG